MNPFSIHPSKFDPLKSYYALVVSVGFESRCTQIAEGVRSASNRIAYVYSFDQSLQAAQNRTKITQLGFAHWSSSSIDPRREIPELLINCSLANGSRRIAVDISSMTRELMAIWVYSIIQARLSVDIEVEFVYSHAKFSPPPKKVPLAKSLSSITPEFAGVFDDSTAPVLLILGLGYEPQLAMSFFEYLEPANVFVFEPAHHDRQYTRAIRETNKALFDIVGEKCIWRYNVFSPYTLFQDLESSIQGAAYDNRVHIAPYGTKLFAICSLLAAAMHYPKIFVWNQNALQPADSSDRIADGRISSLLVKIPRKVEDSSV